ncbi:hypothetical protein AQ490_13145 [Wenjunlia vitaminophila]|uniref:Uncharacterized protein n=1 Tax=Wenjunlia vitaminophila TaxID=76728 RepID=A0A0T6LXY9_WENVI|nr:hypothetical protein AQ490_13145 [Wenjunlia vitaminophila]
MVCGEGRTAVDTVALSEEITREVTAVVTAHGTAVLIQAEDAPAGATVSLGQRLLHRIIGRPGSQPGVEGAVAELAEEPDDADAQGALRRQIKKVLLGDEELAADLAHMVGGYPGGATITASGHRAVAAQTIHGAVSTGDAITNHPGTGSTGGRDGHPN